MERQSAGETFYVNIKDIDFGERIREEYDVHCDGLFDSIKKHGQLVPIILIEKDKKLFLRAGGRRITALKMLGEAQVRAEIWSSEFDENPLEIEGAENNARKTFSFKETISYVKKRQQQITESLGERRGRKKLKTFDSEEDVNPPNSADLPEEGKESLSFLAKEVGWGKEKLQKGLKVVENAIPEVVDAIGREHVETGNGERKPCGGLSVHGAYKISQLPRKNQLQALNDAVKFYDTESDDLSKYNKARRKMKRAKKDKRPLTPRLDPVYNIVRIAPDWTEVVIDDLYGLPVAGYCTQSAVVCIEVDTDHIPQVFDCIDRWGFTYGAMISISHPKLPDEDQHHFIRRRGRHLVIAYAWTDASTHPLHRVYKEAVAQEVSPKVDLIDIIDRMFPAPEDRRLDMSATEERKGWAVWKILYNDTEED